MVFHIFNLFFRVEKVNADYLNKTIGIDISASKISQILTKMCLELVIVSIFNIKVDFQQLACFTFVNLFLFI